MLAGRRLRNPILLLASLLFYAWGEQELVGLLLFSIGVNYVFGLIIEKKRTQDKGRTALVMAIFFNLVFLGFFKYANFFVDNLNAVLKWVGMGPIELAAIHLPIGISFFTFQAMSYVIDIYRLKVPAQKNFLNIALYISLFPQLIAGPIVRYNDIAKQLKERWVTFPNVAQGIKRFIVGLGKKVLIANTLGEVVDKVFAHPTGNVPVLLAWIGIVFYALQIYFDFSGYSDMAIGLGRILGFKFLENFNFPYISKSLTEFWRRWHISLSRWLQDYLFLPIVYAIFRRNPQNKVLGIKTEYFAYSAGMLVTMFLGGLWHGASWSFVIWGVWHGVFVVLEKTLLRRGLKRLWTPLRHVYAILIIIIAWVFFRSPTLSYAVTYLKSMFGFNTAYFKPNEIFLWLNNKIVFVWLIAMISCSPLFLYLQQKAKRILDSGIPRLIEAPMRNLAIVCNYFLYLGIYFLSAMHLAAGTYNPFIYFRF